MTDLLRPTARRDDAAPVQSAAGRSRALAGAVAGVTAAASVLLVSVAVALAGWFAADAGRYGDTRDAVRVGADAWLLAHGAGLRLDAATITLLPLGLTLLAAWAAFRAGRRAARSAALGADEEDLCAAGTVIGVQTTVYAVLVLVTAVLATHPGADSSLLRALLGGFLLSGLAGGAGVLVGSGHAPALVDRLPAWGRPVLTGAAATLLLLLAASSLLLTVALLVDIGTAATVLSRLHADGPAGLMYTLVGIAFVPNAVLLTSAYLLGPGFAVGAGTVVSPTAVMLGPVPAFPLLAALPDDGATPGWTTAFLGVPVLLAALAMTLVARRRAVNRIDHGAAYGLGAGVLAAVAVTLLVALAGGAAGPGRMGDVGAPVLDTFLAAAVSLGAGGLLGGAGGAWASRRRRGEESTGEESTGKESTGETPGA